MQAGGSSHDVVQQQQQRPGTQLNARLSSLGLAQHHTHIPICQCFHIKQAHTHKKRERGRERQWWGEEVRNVERKREGRVGKTARITQEW